MTANQSSQSGSGAAGDIGADSFLVLRRAFFDDAGNPVPFHLEPKGNVQDDPLDRHIASVLRTGLAGKRTVQSADKPLVSPDIVVFDSGAVQAALTRGRELRADELVAIEVKKLEVKAGDAVPRPSGLDYNSTPPCGTVRVHVAAGYIEVPGFYLFVLQQAGAGGDVELTSLVLCHGDVLNSDKSIYEEAVSPRTKRIGLGSYGEGLDRVRPMFVFPNPLGWTFLVGAVTFIHPAADLASRHPELHRVGSPRRWTGAHIQLLPARVRRCRARVRLGPQSVPAPAEPDRRNAGPRTIRARPLRGARGPKRLAVCRRLGRRRHPRAARAPGGRGDASQVVAPPQ
jgi:hypothetical protein